MTATVELLAAALLLIACLGAWSFLLRRRAGDGSLIPYEPRTPAPWDAGVLMSIVIIFVLVRIAAGEWVALLIQSNAELSTAVKEMADSPAVWGLPGYAPLMFQTAAASQAITGIIAVFLVRFNGALRDDLGFSTRRLGGDLWLGVVGFFALAVPAVIIQAVLQTLVAKSQHPIVLAFQNGADGQTFFWAAMAAVVVAPVAEEFLFRGVLQGWLERVWTPPVAAAPADGTDLPVIEVVAPPSAMPILISSAIFALMHFGSGVDVVALFFLALGLGYLYRQTHRLWPGIVVHTLLNAFSLAMLLVEATA